GTELSEHLRHSRIIDDRLDIQVVPASLLVEHFSSKLDGPHALFAPNEVLDLITRMRGDDEVQPVATRLVSRGGDDLDDVAVLEAGAGRRPLSVGVGAH